ncbi:glycosyltransferase family 4 protein [Flavobacterium flavipallidum]|uniref:Glycosyltransferase family 4 protein n=1 Tax=Flavobacterium flavipallidum TaxID=3139140 RepID=A0ABU9HK67_9FLAO
MKILYCTNQLSTHGGIERMLSQKINFLLQQNKDEVFLATFEQLGMPDVYPLDNKLTRFDLAINYHKNRSYFHPKNLVKILKHYFKLRRLIKKIQPDIIVSVSYTPEQFFLPYIQKQIPKIKELHSSGIVVGISGKKEKKSIKENLTSIFKRYNALVVLNKDEVPYFEGCNTVVIPNFTDFKSDLSTKYVKEKTIIAAGRIAPVKQFQELIHIWKMIHDNFTDWKIKLFGDGEPQLVTELQELIQSFNLESSFLLMPATANLQEELEKASIYAMTSATECFPMVLLEAQVSALPIVSYDCPFGPRNIITNEFDGYLTPQNNREYFAKSLSELMLDESKRNYLGENARQSVIRFSKENVMAQWDDLFNQLVFKQ